MTTSIPKHTILMLKGILQLILWVAFGTGSLHAAASQVHPKVGMAVGAAFGVDPQGHVSPLKAGQPLPPGSRIQTGPDAIVVLVFPDNARVSLRADSELILHKYALDPTGLDTRMELELLRGTMRQISGTAAHIQPDRYRLKTPIAVIGVRGTDFLAQTQGQALEAFVQEGAILVTPSGVPCHQATDCQAISLVSGNGVGAFLHLRNSGQFERKQLDPQEVERVFGIGVAGLGAQAGRANMAVSPALDEGRVKPLVADSTVVGESLVSSVVPPAVIPPLPPVEPVSPPVEPVTPPVVVEPVPPVTQLVWGRFGNKPELLAYQTLLPYAEASQGRHVRVGLLSQFALWRTDPRGDLQPGLAGQVNFRLAQAEAFLHQNGAVSPASIDQAQLSVDFDRAQFQTLLALNHSQTGAQTIQASGAINSEGVFQAVVAPATDRVAGALSRDGAEAGMLFSRELPQGTLQGVTLWHK